MRLFLCLPRFGIILTGELCRARVALAALVRGKVVTGFLFAPNGRPLRVCEGFVCPGEILTTLPPAAGILCFHFAADIIREGVTFW